MTHDTDYFRRRAAEARAAAYPRTSRERAEIAGDLALAYAALARRRARRAAARPPRKKSRAIPLRAASQAQIQPRRLK